MATSVSGYLEHLPAMFQEAPFLGQFLLAFERILTGFDTPDPPDVPPIPPGIEQVLARIHTYFDPQQTRSDFLPWLAGWVATSLRDDWDEQTRRAFIANVVPIYRQRGTLRGLQMMLQVYLKPTLDPQAETNQVVQVLDSPAPSDPDQTPFPPRYFQVRFTVDEHDPQLLARRAAIATYIIDREKPAHTYYGIRISFPSLEISDPPSFGPDGKPDLVRGVFVGRNTVLGGAVFKS